MATSLSKRPVKKTDCERKDRDTNGSSSKRKKTRSIASEADKDKGEKSTLQMSQMMKTERTGDVFSPEAKDTMRKFVDQITQGGVHSLRLNYAELKTFVPSDNAKTSSDANPTKCRYKDVGCLDKSRVVLKWPPDVKGDFVHANWVNHKLLDNTFICCQGPMESTVPDFWRMIWQERVKQIFMLCRCEELGKEKCAQYWPANKDESKSFHGLTIKNERVDISDPSFVQSRLLLTYEKEQRHVDHRQWTKWPDKSVPKTPMAPFRLLQFSRKYTKNPTVIHCSAGIGRTGTMVAIEIVYKSLYQGKMPDFMQLTKDLRSQRSQAVQTEDQYVYVHYALMQLLLTKQVVSQQDIRPFCKEYENYLKLLNDNGGKQLPIEATSTPVPPAKSPKGKGEHHEAHVEPDPKKSDKTDRESKKSSSAVKKKKEESKTEVKPPMANEESKRKRKKLSLKPNRSESKVGGGGNESKREKKERKEKKEKPAEKEKPVEEGPKKEKDEEKKIDVPEVLPSTPPLAPSPSNPVVVAPPLPSPESKPAHGETKPEPAPLASPTAPAQPVAAQYPESAGMEDAHPPPAAETPNTVPAPVAALIHPAPTQAAPTHAAPPHVAPQPSPTAHNDAHSTPPLETQPPASHEPAATPTPAQPVPAAAVTAEVAPKPAAQKFNYAPAKTYTVQTAGGKKAIVYTRSVQPFIKAIASPQGHHMPQIFVANRNVTNQQTPPTPQPPHGENQNHQ